MESIKAQSNAASNPDTIPPKLKQIFFKDKSVPNLIRDYHVVGFDADHCLVKYNIRKLCELMSRVIA